MNILKVMKKNQWTFAKAQWLEGDGFTFFLIKEDGSVFGQGNYQQSVGCMNLAYVSHQERKHIFLHLQEASPEDIAIAPSEWVHHSVLVKEKKTPREFFYGAHSVERFKPQEQITCLLPLESQKRVYTYHPEREMQAFWECEMREAMEVLVFEGQTLTQKTIQKGQKVFAGNCLNIKPHQLTVKSPFNAQHAFIMTIDDIVLTDKQHPYF